MSEEAQVDSYAEQVFDADMDTNMDMDEGPDSFDDLMSEEYDNDTSNKESVQEDADRDSEIPNGERDQESEEASDEDRPDASEADAASDKREEEAGEESKRDLEEKEEKEEEGEEVDSDPVQKYLKEEEEVKVNGELQKYSREHIISKGKEMIAGEIAYDKKFTELDIERKQYQNEVSEVEGYINKFGEIAKTGDILGALQYFSEFTSIPPYELKQQLMQQMAPEVDRLRGLSEPEIELEYTKQQNDYLQKKYETENQKLESQQSQRELESHVEGLQQTHNIAPTEWSSAIEVLEEHLPEDQELTPELVVSYVAYTQAESLLDSVDVNLKQDGEVLDEMQRIIARNPEFTDDDLKDIINNAFGGQKEEGQNQELKRKVDSNSPKQLEQKSQSMMNPITIDGEEVDDFDDIL